jgi:hypothetical protein
MEEDSHPILQYADERQAIIEPVGHIRPLMVRAGQFGHTRGRRSREIGLYEALRTQDLLQLPEGALVPR